MSKALRFVSRIAPTVLTAAGVIYLVYMIISSSPSAKAGLLSYIYCVGSSGYSPENLSYYAKASSAGVSDWIATSSYPVGVDDAGCSIYRNYIYCVGTNATEQENQTYYAPISGSGIGKWIATTPYPIKFWLAGCSAYNGYLYCVGDWLAPSNQAYYAPIARNGIGKWSGTTGYPIPMYWAGCSIYDGFIYCVGSGAVAHKPGESEPQKGEPGAQDMNATFFAAVSRNGIGNWTRTTDYPGPMVFGGCSIYNSYIYCVGGEYLGNQTYYAKVSRNGIGSWTRTTDAPIGIVEGACPIHNGYIYCVGSRDNRSIGHQVWYAPVSGSGIGAWKESTPYPIPYWGDSYCQMPGSGGGFLGGGGPD